MQKRIGTKVETWRPSKKSRSVLYIATVETALYISFLYPSFSKEQLVLSRKAIISSSNHFALISGFRSINFHLDSAGPLLLSRELRLERGDK